MKIQRFLAVTAVLSFSVFLGSCDPSKALNKAFAKLGLTRLALVRTDLEPGALVVSSKNNAVFADNITDYVPTAKLSMQFEDRSKEASGYIPQIEGSSSIEPKLALDLLASVVPLNSSADFKFTSKVSITQMECKLKRVPIPEITKFLRDANNSDLAVGLKPFFDENDDIFIVYEVWRSSKMDFSSETGTDITVSVKVGEVKPISKAEGSLAVSRTQKEKLTVSGDQPYAFAVKLLKLVRDPKNGNLSVRLTNFKPPNVTKGPDDQYTFVSDEMQGLEIKRVPESQRLSALKAQ